MKQAFYYTDTDTDIDTQTKTQTDRQTDMKHYGCWGDEANKYLQKLSQRASNDSGKKLQRIYVLLVEMLLNDIAVVQR